MEVAKTDETILLKIIATKLGQSGDESFKSIGLTVSQSQALEAISSSKRPITQKELQEILCLSHSVTHGLLVRLESKGYVEIIVPKEDKRQKLLALTKEGAKAHRRLSCQKRKAQSYFDCLSKQEQEEFLRLLKKVAASLMKKGEIK